MVLPESWSWYRRVVRPPLSRIVHRSRPRAASASDRALSRVRGPPGNRWTTSGEPDVSDSPGTLESGTGPEPSSLPGPVDAGSRRDVAGRDVAAGASAGTTSGTGAPDGQTADAGAGTVPPDTVSKRVTGVLRGGWDADRWRWPGQFDRTRAVTVALEGPAMADFDLYVTEDGRRPTELDHDVASTSRDATETVALSSVDGSLGVLVTSYRGRGRYDLRVEEEGVGSARDGEPALDPFAASDD